MQTDGLKQKLIRTLVGSGFALIPPAYSKTNCFAIFVERNDLFGVRVKYLIALSERPFGEVDVTSLSEDAEHHHAALVLVGDADFVPDKIPLLSFEQFTDRLGGEILSLLPREPEYAQRLQILGNNKLPRGMQGEADKLFEQYVHAGLQFLFRSRVIQYGNERLFESVPDGLAIGQDIPLLLYDAKAAGDGYEMSANTERQFIIYVQKFNRKYQHLLGPLRAFLVIGGKFADSEESLRGRSRAVQSECNVPLCFLDADNFGKIVGLLTDEPLFRKSIAWHWVFTNSVVKASDVQKSLREAQRDKVVPR